MGIGGAQRRVNRRGRGVKVEVTEVKKIGHLGRFGILRRTSPTVSIRRSCCRTGMFWQCPAKSSGDGILNFCPVRVLRGSKVRNWVVLAYFVELLLQFRLDRAVIARGCSGKVQLNPLETEF